MRRHQDVTPKVGQAVSRTAARPQATAPNPGRSPQVAALDAQVEERRRREALERIEDRIAQLTHYQTAGVADPEYQENIFNQKRDLLAQRAALLNGDDDYANVSAPPPARGPGQARGGGGGGVRGRVDDGGGYARRVGNQGGGGVPGSRRNLDDQFLADQRDGGGGGGGGGGGHHSTALHDDEVPFFDRQFDGDRMVDEVHGGGGGGGSGGGYPPHDPRREAQRQYAADLEAQMREKEDRERNARAASASRARRAAEAANGGGDEEARYARMRKAEEQQLYAAQLEEQIYEREMAARRQPTPVQGSRFDGGDPFSHDKRAQQEVYRRELEAQMREKEAMKGREDADGRNAHPRNQVPLGGSAGAALSAPTNVSYAPGFGPTGQESAGAAQKRDRQRQYAEELKAQMRVQEEKKRKEKEAELADQMRVEREAANYNPFGKGGGGAPLRDTSGHVVANLRAVLTEPVVVDKTGVITSPRDHQQQFAQPQRGGGPPPQAAPMGADPYGGGGGGGGFGNDGGDPYAAYAAPRSVGEDPYAGQGFAPRQPPMRGGGPPPQVPPLDLGGRQGQPQHQPPMRQPGYGPAPTGNQPQRGGGGGGGGGSGGGDVVQLAGYRIDGMDIGDPGELMRKQRAQAELQDYLKQQIEEKKARKEEEARKIAAEEAREMERIKAEQERIQAELEEEKRKERTRIEDLQRQTREREEEERRRREAEARADREREERARAEQEAAAREREQEAAAAAAAREREREEEERARLQRGSAPVHRGGFHDPDDRPAYAGATGPVDEGPLPSAPAAARYNPADDRPIGGSGGGGGGGAVGGVGGGGDATRVNMRESAYEERVHEPPQFGRRSRPASGKPQPRVVASPRTRAPPLDPPSPAAAAPETFERAPAAAPAERASRTRPRSGRQAQATSREPPPREPVRVAVRQPPARVDRGGGGGGGGGGYERNTGRGRGDDLWERDNLVRHVQNASEFDALKYHEVSDTVRHDFLSDHPRPAAAGEDLDAQQKALIRLQEQRLAELEQRDPLDGRDALDDFLDFHGAPGPAPGRYAAGGGGGGGGGRGRPPSATTRAGGGGDGGRSSRNRNRFDYFERGASREGRRGDPSGRVSQQSLAAESAFVFEDGGTPEKVMLSARGGRPARGTANNRYANAGAVSPDPRGGGGGGGGRGGGGRYASPPDANTSADTINSINIDSIYERNAARLQRLRELDAVEKDDDSLDILMNFLEVGKGRRQQQRRGAPRYR